MATESLDGRLRTIDRVTCQQFAHGYIQASEPAILVDALDDWHVDELWSLEYLTRAVGHKRVVVSFSKRGFFYNQSEFNDAEKACEYHRSEMAFGQAIQTINSASEGQHIYILQQSLKDKLPELLGNLSVPQWNKSASPDFNLWLGRDTRGALHHDFADNFFAQVYGTKSFVVFSPEDSDFLYPYSPDAFMLHCSHVNANNPDLVRYPNSSLASPISFELRAGEMLYLPAYWWHQVDSIGMSISVSNWASERFAQLIDAPNSTRGLIFEYRKDRLVRYREECLRAENLDFENAASQLLERGRTCSAYILTLAALDELVTNYYPRIRAKGSSLKELSEEMRAAWEMIRNLPLLSRKVAVGSALQSTAELTLVTSRCDDEKIGRPEVIGLLDAIKELRTELQSRPIPRFSGSELSI